MLLLIPVTYALSATITAAWAVSLVRRPRHAAARKVTSGLLVVSAAVAILSLFISRHVVGGVMAVVSGLVYLAAPVIIVRRLVLRQPWTPRPCSARSPPT